MLQVRNSMYFPLRMPGLGLEKLGLEKLGLEKLAPDIRNVSMPRRALVSGFSVALSDSFPVCACLVAISIAAVSLQVFL